MAMTNGKLIRLQSSHNNLRSDEIVGGFELLPQIQKRFHFFAEPLDKSLGPEYQRWIMTTEVQSTEFYLGWPRSFVEFKTKNSTYRLEFE